MGRGKAGRKRKPGPRSPSGRLSRVGAVPSFDKGTERTQAMQVLYGTDGNDAIGRAFRAGLLGDGSDAKALLDTARRIANAYWTAFSTGSYQCPLGDRSFGSIADINHERVKRREQWLTECLRVVETMGLRSQFDQLVINVNPDHGPAFLDRLIYARRVKRETFPTDERWLEQALEALSELVS